MAPIREVARPKAGKDFRRTAVRRTAGGSTRATQALHAARHPDREDQPDDPDSRNVKTRSGYLQGYNAQAAVTCGQIVIAAEISVNSPDFGLLGTVMNAALGELDAVGVTDTPSVLVADTGYWHQVQMEQIVEHGTQVLIPPDAGNRKTPRPGWNGGTTPSCACLTPARRRSVPQT